MGGIFPRRMAEHRRGMNVGSEVCPLDLGWQLGWPWRANWMTRCSSELPVVQFKQFLYKRLQNYEFLRLRKTRSLTPSLRAEID